MTKPKPLDLEDIEKKVLEELPIVVGDTYTKISEEKRIEQVIKGAIKLTIKEIKQRIKKACEFWLRYRDNPILLWKEKPKFRKLIKKESWCDVDGPDLHSDEDMQDYNLWLFKLTFKGVFKEEIEK